MNSAAIQYVRKPEAFATFISPIDMTLFTGGGSMLFSTEGLEHIEEIRFSKCIYIEDACLEHLSQIKTLQDSLKHMTVVSCGNVTDKGIIALHHLRNLEWLLLSDLPGVKDKDQTVDRLQTALPRLTIELDLA
ncbi:hypothetical protein cypCar_00020038 [Cyprinus carpio]|nr:hypothetical protein cypCar_00020038 [Cyprinus carpio]